MLMYSLFKCDNIKYTFESKSLLLNSFELLREPCVALRLLLSCKMVMHIPRKRTQQGSLKKDMQIPQ